MKIFNLLYSILFFLTLTGCVNEPFTLTSLRVTSLQRVDNTIVNTFQYKNNRLYTFKQVNPSLTTSSKFYYRNDSLIKIITDSTATAYTLTELIYTEAGIGGDSVFTVVDKIKTKKAVRSFSFDEANQLINVKERIWTNDVFADSEITLERTAGNVTRFEIYTVTETVKEIVKSLSFKYDDRKSAYPPDFVYFYTLPSTELYRMSINNPTTITEKEKKDLITQYWYNKFDYPSNFKDGSGKVYGVDYTESN
jgi:hypothetical protein